MKNILSTIIFIFFLFSNKVLSLEAGKWTYVQDKEWCYIGSLAVETDLPENKKRGDNYILVYRIIGNPEKIIQIEAGYNYKLNQDIVVKIDNINFKFYTTEDVSDSAWTDKDSDVIFAMKKGLDLTVTGESSRGTITNDKYTLKGFTAAFNKLSTDCK